MGDPEKEVDVEVAGQKFRAKNYRLIDLIWLPLVLGPELAIASMPAPVNLNSGKHSSLK